MIFLVPVFVDGSKPSGLERITLFLSSLDSFALLHSEAFCSASSMPVFDELRMAISKGEVCAVAGRQGLG